MAPNQLLYRRYWSRVREEWRRRKPGVSAQWSLYAGPQVSRSFIDYSINVPGTVPEKLLYNALDRQGVDFYFSSNFGDLPFTSEREAIRPDFIIPAVGIVIEVWGVYWHSQPGHYEHDAKKAYALLAAGWKLYTLMDSDIIRDPYMALNTIPEMRGLSGGGRSRNVWHPDPTASLRAQRQAWPKGIVAKYKTAGMHKGAVYYSFRGTGGRPAAIPVTPGALFTSDQIDPKYAAEWIAYGKEWKAYIDRLGRAFASPDTQRANPGLYQQYLWWRKWWEMFGRF